MILTAKYVLPVTRAPIREGAILVNGNTIEELGKRNEVVSGNPAEEVIEFSDAALIPGFVNTHVHLEYTILKGLEDNLPLIPWLEKAIVENVRKMNLNDFKVSAELGTLEMLKAGITCVADVTSTGASFDAIRNSHIRGVIYQEVSGLLENKDSHELLDEIMKKVEGMLKKANKSVKIGVSPHSPYMVPGPLFKLLDDECRIRNLPMCVHIGESSEEVQFIEFGTGMISNIVRKANVVWEPKKMGPVMYLNSLGVLNSNVLAVHCVKVTSSEVSILKGQDVAISHNPVSNAKLANGVAPFTKFLHEGIRLGLGTDSAASNNSLDLFEEMKFAILIQRALSEKPTILTAERLLKIATIGGAHALKMNKIVGSLDVGKKADIVAISMDQPHTVPTYDPFSTLVYCANQSDVQFVMINGKIVVENRQVKTINETEILERSEKIKEKIVRS